jgi:putative ABC transport system permease protein
MSAANEARVGVLPAPKVRRKGGMTVGEAFRIALQGLLANKLRSVLTMLGIIIGVGAFIIMVSLGQGVAKATQDSIRKLGTNVLTVVPQAQQTRGVSQGMGSSQTLKFEDAEAIKKNCPSVKAVAPEYSGRGVRVKFQNQNTTTTVLGSTPEYFEIRNQPLAKGKLFDDDDVKRKAKVCVIGDNIRETIFGSNDPINKYLKLAGQNFKVLGVIQKRGGTPFRNPDDQITIPITTAMKRVFSVEYLGSISVQAINDKKMLEAEDEIKAAVRKSQKLRADEPDSIRIFNQADLSDSAAQQSTFMTLLLAGIALVSLVVGGIGIMNIMLVSVTERTREIGIRKAIGAKRKDILYQFLIESVTMSLVGGLIGIALGIGISLQMAKTPDQGGAGFPMLLSMQPILISFGFSAAVGIFFGIYPAIKASALNPIEALRYE